MYVELCAILSVHSVHPNTTSQDAEPVTTKILILSSLSQLLLVCLYHLSCGRMGLLFLIIIHPKAIQVVVCLTADYHSTLWKVLKLPVTKYPGVPILKLLQIKFPLDSSGKWAHL